MQKGTRRRNRDQSQSSGLSVVGVTLLCRRLDVGGMSAYLAETGVVLPVAPLNIVTSRCGKGMLIPCSAKASQSAR